MGHLLEMMKYGQSLSDDAEEDFESEMCNLPKKLSEEAEGLEVTIFLSKVPFLSGAVECVGLGVLSSLHPQVEYTL
jgi:hypothetical protein